MVLVGPRMRSGDFYGKIPLHRKKRRAPARKPRLAATTALVHRVLSRQLETKYRYDYSGVDFPGIGTYPGTVCGHNGTISNLSDIHRMIPPIASLVANDTQNTRQGIKIDVMKLKADLDFSIKDDAIHPSPRALNLMAVVYVWQHKQFKSYKQLEASNNFGQFLDRGNGTTGAFSGIACDAKLPLARDHYKLCKKFVFPLRTDGTANGSVVGTGVYVSNTNASPFTRRISLDLTKFVPKKLQYPVQATTPTVDPTIDSYPTNSSLCMSVGFYNMDLVEDDTTSEPLINVQWVTQLTFKDA